MRRCGGRHGDDDDALRGAAAEVEVAADDGGEAQVQVHGGASALGLGCGMRRVGLPGRFQ